MPIPLPFHDSQKNDMSRKKPLRNQYSFFASITLAVFYIYFAYSDVRYRKLLKKSFAL